MQQQGKIFVTGATGNQGGAVVRSLVKNGFKVKVLVRDASSPEAKVLKELNGEIIQGDLNNPESYSDQLDNLSGIFSVQTFANGTQKEIKQGIALANLAKAHHADFFLYSSVLGADLHSGVPIWESKFIIENHLRQLGLPFCIIRPASFFENFQIPAVKKRILNGKLSSPIDRNILQPFLSVRDIGTVAAAIFQNKEKFLGKTISLVAAEMNLDEVAAIFSESLGKEIKYQQLPMFLTRLIMGRDLYKMFDWVNKNKGRAFWTKEKFNEELPHLMDFRQWISTIKYGL
jgi:uncharacterized protein YbjT (DUF2867 family)